MIDKLESKLVNDVARVIKMLIEHGIQHDKLTVKYDFAYRNDGTSARAYVMFPTCNYSTGNGHERTYGHELISKIVELADKHGISYHLGLTENLDMHIQVYVQR